MKKFKLVIFPYFKGRGKILRTMKLTLILLTMFVFQVSASVYSQSTKFSFDVNNKQVVDILREIEDQSEFRFFFQREQVNVERKVDLHVTDQTVEQILNKLFEGQKVNFQVREDNLILLKPEGTSSEFPGSLSNQQQQKTITGKVTDSAGLPLPGVTVLVKGTTQGTVTSPDGVFSISDLPAKATLVFSFVGMHTQEITVGNQTTINVVLEEETIGLEEVVAIGYGTQKKVNLSGAVSHVDSEVLESRPLANVAQGLQGLIPNLNITNSSGAPGISSSFNIRGYTSINGGEPLVLIDGSPGDLNMLNPNDIAEVSVLKDAASAAIYGARGAFGVILVSTKSGGSSDDPKISMSMNYAVNKPTYRMETMNSMEVMDYMNEGYMRINGRPYFDEHWEAALVAHYNDPENNPGSFHHPNFPPYVLRPSGNTDWVNELWKETYPMQQYSISVSGGSEKLEYYTSISYLNQKGMPKHFDEKYNRYNLLANIKYDIRDWFAVKLNLTTNLSDKIHPPDTNSGRHPENYSPFWVNMLSYYPIYTPDGRYYQSGAIPNMVQMHKEGGYRTRDITDVWVRGGAVLTPVKNMSFNIDYSANINDREEVSYWRRLVGYNTDPGPYEPVIYPHMNPSRVTKNNRDTRYYVFNAFADYENTFLDKHNFKAMVGFNQENSVIKAFEAYREILTVESLPYMSLASGQMNVDDYKNTYALRGAFARVNYNFDEKYFLEFNGRYDGSSKFPKADRYAFFPSLSLAWRLDNEEFLGLDNSFDMLKIRASYGSLGNQAVGGYYPYISTYSSGQVNWLLGGEKPMTVYSGGLISPTLTWETVSQRNIGVDFAILNSRLSGSLDIYRRDTKDMLTASEPLPSVLGVSEPRANAADLKTTGFDFQLSWKQRVQDLSLGLTFILSDYISEITKFDNPKGLISTHYVGKRIGDIWGFVTEGLFQSDEEAAAWNQKQIIGRTMQAGDIKFADIDGDGKITRGSSTLDDPGDRKIIGNNTPRYSFGFKPNASWKGFDLDLFLQGVMKRDQWISTRYFLTQYTGEWYAYPKFGLDYWSEDNRDAYFPRPLVGGGTEVVETQTRFLQNAAYLRIKEITLGYTIPALASKNIGIDRVRVYLSGHNLCEFTKMMEVSDPELSGSHVYPIYRSYSFGVNINF